MTKLNYDRGIFARDANGNIFTVNRESWERSEARDEHLRKAEHPSLTQVFLGKMSAKEYLDQTSAEHAEKSFAAVAAGDESDLHDEETPVDELVGGGNDHHASKVADLLVESGTHTDRGQALAWLLHHRDGNALLRRLKKQHEEPSMTKEQLESARMAKLRALNPVDICKALVAENSARGISESELVELVSNHDRQPGETAAKCFERHYMANAEVRKAISIAKEAASIEPIVVEGNDANPDDAAEATAALNRLVEEQRARAPWMTAMQAFDAVMAKNADLTKRAIPRLTPTTNYPRPR